MVEDHPPQDGPLLNQINLIASNVHASTDFYRLLGFEPVEGVPAWREHHVAFALPGGMLLEIDSDAFAGMWDRGLTLPGPRAVLGFGVPDRESVDRTYERLTEAGYRSAQPPYDAFWGSRFAIVEDPDGNPVGLMSPSDPEWRSAPPAPPS